MLSPTVVLLVVILLVQLLILRQSRSGAIGARLDAFERNQERAERAVAEALAQIREETSCHASRSREEQLLSLKAFGDSLQTRITDSGALLARHSDLVQQQFGAFRNDSALAAKDHRHELSEKLASFHGVMSRSLEQVSELQKNEIERLRNIVDVRLREIRDDNTKQLEQMRATVEEKLQGTLEKRLGESFKQVSERLELVHKGLGEMQVLANGVGDLKKVLTNVKARGVLGEVLLGALLEEMLTTDQYGRNVATKEGSEAVEFAIKLPGLDHGETVWLPIDSKFPTEDYQRLWEAQAAADPEAAASASKQLDSRLRSFAGDICKKYINPPKTTDFAIMFLPTEGLYAEAVRRMGLVDAIRRDCKVVIAGPSTFAALLNSLQMGFRTLAIQQHSGEVWRALNDVKREFAKFGDSIRAVKKKLAEASNKMGDVDIRTRALTKRLHDVERLPIGKEAASVLQLLPDLGESDGLSEEADDEAVEVEAVIEDGEVEVVND